MASQALIDAARSLRSQAHAGEPAARQRALAVQKTLKPTARQAKLEKEWRQERAALETPGNGVLTKNKSGGGSPLGNAVGAIGKVGKGAGITALKGIDLGRAAVESTLVRGAANVGNELRPLIGKKKRDLTAAGLGWDTWDNDIAKHTGFGELAARAAGKQPGESLTGSKVGDFVVGTAGDVGLDPLTYIAPYIKAGRVPAVVQKLIEAGKVEEATTLLRSKSAASLSKATLESIGEKAGLKFGPLDKTIVPHSVYKGITAPTRALRSVAGDALEKIPAVARHRGISGVTRAAERSGMSDIAIPAFLSSRAENTERLAAAGLAGEWATKWHSITKDLPNDASDVITALEEGDGAALRDLAHRGVPVAEIQGWFDQIHADLRAAGVQVGKIEGYVPRWLSDEMKVLKGAGKKGTVSEAVSSLTKSRHITVGSSLDWIEPALVVPAFTGTAREVQSQVRAFVNQEARRVLGSDFYSTDLKNLGRLYARQAGRVLGKARWTQRLESAGLAVRAEDQGILKAAEKGIPKQAEKAAAAQADAATAHSAMLQHHTPEDWAALEGEQATLGQPRTAVQDVKAGRATQHDVIEQTLADPTTPRTKFEEAALQSEQDAADWEKHAATETDPLQKDLAVLRADEARALARNERAINKGLQHEIKVAQVKFKVTEKAGREIDQLAMGWVAAHPEWRFDPAIADALQKVAELTQPRNLNAFWRHYDQVQGFVKTYQLLSPGFHFRNLYGGIFNNALADIDRRVYPKWFQANLAWGKSGLEGPRWAKFAAKHPDLADAYQKARRITSQGQFGFELDAAGKGGTFGTRNVLVRANKKGGQSVESFLRGSLAMDSFLKGGSADDAVGLVSMFHFDYGDLTSAEQNLKRVIPFYTWTRRNLPLQVEMMVRRPSVYSKYNALTRNLSAGVPLPSVVPKYYGDQGMVPTQFTEQGQRVFFNPTNELPVGDVLDNPADPSRWLSMVTPLLKTPAELGRDKQFFKGLPVTGRPVDLPTPYKQVPGLEVAMRAVGAMNKDGKVRDDVLYSLDQFFPLLAKGRRNFPSEKKYQERLWTQRLNFLLGLGLRTDTKSEQQSELIRRKFEKK